MKEKDIEEKLKRMAELLKHFKPIQAEIDMEKKEYADLETELIGLAKNEKWPDSRAFTNGQIKINPGKGALAVLTDAEHAEHSFDKAAIIARDKRWTRFYKPVYKLIKNRVKEEAKPEELKVLGLEIVKDDSISVEVF